MRRGGARGPRVAAAAAALALLLLPSLLSVSPPAQAQSFTDSWWGASERQRPTEGWAVRVPVTVRNDHDYPLVNHTVAVDLDFGALLVKAGWTNQTVGASTTVRGFTLDVDSLRVVPYVRGFNAGPLEGSTTRPAPHRFYEAPFQAARHREFDAARNPAGTLLFVAEGVMQPGEARSYYVYANPLEFRDTPPAGFTLQQTAPLDAYLWGTQGTVHYGFEPQQQGTTHKVLVRALHPGKTTVALHLYTLGRFSLAPPGPGGSNPVELSLSSFGDADAGAVFFVPAGQAFKIEATRPVAVAGHGALDTAGWTTETFGYVPSNTGSYAGSEFDVYGFKSPDASFVTVTKTTPGSVTVTYGTTAPPASVTLTPASPSANVPIPAGRWSKIRATGGDVLVSMHPLVPRASPIHTIQVPALTGGPMGTAFVGGLAPDGGFARFCTEARATLRVLDALKPSLQIHPEGVADGTPPAFVQGCSEFLAGPGTPPDPLEFWSTKEEKYPVEDAPVPFSLVLGAGERAGSTPKRGSVGHWGGAGGVDFKVSGRVGVFGHFNDTRLLVAEERLRNGVPTLVNRSPISIGADGFFALDPGATPDATGRYHVRATKPVQVVSLEPAEHPYARYVPGRPANPTVVVGAAEFRGPLVELRSPDTDGRQLFRSTGPGNPLSFRLDVLNLGRWMGGEGLPDVVEVTCERPEGWKVDGCDKEVRLDSRAAERLAILVTPPAEDVNATKAVNVTAKSRGGGVSAVFRLLVYVEVKYGVGMWFDVEGGRKSMDPPVGVEPGATHRYRVVVKNTGSTADTFQLSVDPPAPGWTQALLHEGRPVQRLRLEGGESRALTFEVTAPDAETAPQNLKSISAQSLSSAIAGDVVNTATRIRPKVSVKLALDPQTQVAAPNETVAFNLTVNNSGNDIFRILLIQEGALPRGWSANLSVHEIDLGPGVPFTARLTVTPPPDARAGDLATLKVKAETDVGGGASRIPGDEVAAVTVVRRVHNLTTPALLDAVADPGETLRYLLPLMNAGNGNDAIELLPGAVSPSWRVVADEETLILPVNQTGELALRIDVPPHAPPGVTNLTLTLRLSREDVVNVTIPVDVRPLARVAFSHAADLRLAPGRALALDVEARNEGNLPGDFVFDAHAPPGWRASFEPASARLEPGARATLRLRIDAPRDADVGSQPVALRASLDGAPAGETPLPVLVARPRLVLSDVSASGDLSRGELVLVAATVANRGDLAADNVTLALLVDGRVVDQALLARVPAGASGQATLSWVATEGAGRVEVVLDPQGDYLDEPTQETRAEVVFGSRIPGPAIPLILLGVLALAMARRRRA